MKYFIALIFLSSCATARPDFVIVENIYHHKKNIAVVTGGRRFTVPFSMKVGDTIYIVKSHR